MRTLRTPSVKDMTHDEVEEIVSRFSYKPNATFTYWPWDDKLGHLRFTMPVPPVDTFDTEPFQVVATYGFSLAGLDERGLVQAAQREVVRGVELHEMHEWLRYEEARLVEPHPEFHADGLRLHPLRRAGMI